MKTIGIIGGLSWHSTIKYYQNLNQLINNQLGNSHSARIILYSIDFEDFGILQAKNDWKNIEVLLSEIAAKLENAGAECLVLATNTPHLVADEISRKISIPLIHIAEETAKAIEKNKLQTIGLLGTKFTMEHNFFKDKLKNYGIETIIPDENDRNFIHQSIFQELTKGIFKAETKQKYLEIILDLKKAGAEGVIFGCTEIALLLNPSESSLPVFETTEIHTNAIAEFALTE